MAITGTVLRLYRGFRGRTGGVVGEDAARSLRLAKAYAAARDAGCVFVWEGFGDDWKDRQEWEQENGRRVETSEACILYGPEEVDEDGWGTGDESRPVLASLGGIWDADDEYRRHVEAELAIEAGY